MIRESQNQELVLYLVQNERFKKMAGLKDAQKWWAEEKYGQMLSKTSKETKELMLGSGFFSK